MRFCQIGGDEKGLDFLIRIDKYLAECGLGTRSEVKKIVKDRRVKVGDAIVTDSGLKIDELSEVSLDGKRLYYSKFEYFMLNKPQGVISASKADLRDKNTPCVVDLIDCVRREDFFPVGRLDKDTEGLLLITNDGKLAHELLSPSKHVFKTYYVELNAPLKRAEKARIEAGIDIGDEKPTLPCSIDLLTEERPCCNISISEGRFHQVKRMFEAVGLKVTYLKRLSMGGLKLDETLKLGEYRRLTEEELQLIKEEKD